MKLSYILALLEELASSLLAFDPHVRLAYCLRSKAPRLLALLQVKRRLCQLFIYQRYTLQLFLKLARQSFIVVFAIIFLSKWTLAAAAKEVEFSAKDRLEVVIGQKEPNRISLKQAEVLDIVGDEAKYNLYWSSDLKHFFIVPKVEVGETINVSLILIGGLAQDIRFTIGDVPAQTVLINMDSTSKGTNLWSDQALKDEITAMMQAMLDAGQGKYYVIAANRLISELLPLPPTIKDLLIKEEKIYRYKDLTGIVLTIHNKSAGFAELKESDFSSIFSRLLAVSIETPLLAKGQSGRVFVIIQEQKGGL